MKTKTTTMVKNYYQRRLDSGQKDFEEIVLVAEGKKSRDEATGSLPVPSVAPKRRYGKNPSAIVPRPLAPNGELIAETEDGPFLSKGKPITILPKPRPLHGRPIPQNHRTVSRYRPLAPALTGATASPAISTISEDIATLGWDISGAIRTLIPDLHDGSFVDDRNDSPILPATSQRAQGMKMPSRHSVAAKMPQELSKMDHLSSQGRITGQMAYILPQIHSYHPSPAQAPGSLSQGSQPELDRPSVLHDPFGQGDYHSLTGQPAGPSQSPPLFILPVKDAHPNTAAASEASNRQVPAMRSNTLDGTEEYSPTPLFAC
ncbi:uncharacterized protein N7483_007957 [Penicillium malachiteum]|uniref:uncharacterized protein n=1 Tax=Penicillium malachiteum TaxID=1324776 RepID=UPI002546F7AB|nr:uncharacterized protein N7483_007957 [Penicillium malachiteum]KAJ5726600.1 hypothetical protein N7483_007957 [Penicillium malachiteum]